MVFLDKEKEINEKLSELAIQTQERDAVILAGELGLEYQNLLTTAPQTQALSLVNEEEARKALCASFILNGKDVGLACKDPRLTESKEMIDKLKGKGYQVRIFVVSQASLDQMWQGYLLVGDEKEKITGQINIEFDRLEDLRKNLSNLRKLKEAIANFKSPFASKILEVVLAGSLAINASDVHFEAEEKEARLRYRIDGALHDVASVSSKSYRSVLSRIKLLAGMKINIGAQAQDGRFTIKTSGADIEIRVSIIPSAYGETVVMRVLNPNSIRLELGDLGFREDDLKVIDQEISRPNGIILNTGPTGSGKTTTLYAFLRKIYNPEIKIITIEDPIEYHLDDITQTQVKREKNYTFASGLRSILRQDPDVILVGEIRDQETAEIAMQSSLTGHLVLSTLHTNEAAGAIPRLLDLKIDPGILASALNLAIAQRLARKLCSHCRKKSVLSSEMLEKVKKMLESMPQRVKRPNLKEGFEIFEPDPNGCEKCNFTGYKGRIAIVELLKVDPVIQKAIARKSDLTILEFRELAKKQGMVTMSEDGLLKVLAGITSIKEIESSLGKIF